VEDILYGGNVANTIKLASKLKDLYSPKCIAKTLKPALKHKNEPKD
jgi:hypothetical protein